MTTIILTIIGILLAAAAALMVIFYGGDAFNGGSIGARANTLQNAGTNVISAVQLYRGETGDNDLSSMPDNDGSTDLSIGDLAPSYLKEAPALAGLGTAETFTATAYSVEGVEAEVCAKVNENLGVTGSATAADAKMGCTQADVDTDGTFFASL